MDYQEIFAFTLWVIAITAVIILPLCYMACSFYLFRRDVKGEKNAQYVKLKRNEITDAYVCEYESRPMFGFGRGKIENGIRIQYVGEDGWTHDVTAYNSIGGLLSEIEYQKGADIYIRERGVIKQ